MRYLVISDIHSNYEALEAVMDKAQKEGFDKVICLGDIVGYGADPNLCVESIRNISHITVLGNHDVSLFSYKERRYLNDYARIAIEWTEKSIKKENFEYITSLEYLKKLGNVLICHSSPSNPKEFNYLFSLEDAIYEFERFEENIAFFGHSHIPTIFFEYKDKKEFMFIDVVYDSFKHTEEGIFVCKVENGRYLVNPGSVGQPRDGDRRAAFLIYDDERKEIKFFRVPYNIEMAREKIIKNGLPKILGDRLMIGR